MSGFVPGEALAGNAAAAAQARTAIQTRRIGALFELTPDGSSEMGLGAKQDSPGGPCNTRSADVIIGFGMTPAAIDFGTLCDELDAIIAGPPARDEAARARFERTLTDGYARAHLLEAEQLRIERRIAKIAGQMRHRDRDVKADELADLSLQLSRTSVDLVHLRKLLSEARRQAVTAA